MTDIQTNYLEISSQLEGKNAVLVQVSKKKPIEDLMQVYEIG
ncbi:MAG: hypothetical protein NWP83_00390 [Spirosomaceae bacterium]|nr:hypothetical protein [Spirosomataceae bacterium]